MAFRKFFVGPIVCFLSAVSVFSDLGPAGAAVRLHGFIKWWHPTELKWYAYQQGNLEYEFNGVGFDKDLWTDSDGSYNGAVRNAFFPAEGHTVNVDVYAKRRFPGRSERLYVRVFETMGDIYPTNVPSKSQYVKNNHDEKVDVCFGYSQSLPAAALSECSSAPKTDKGNLLFAGSRYYHLNIAAADIVGRFYSRMAELGLRQHRSVDIIQPSSNLFNGSSYFDVVTNNINIVADQVPGSKVTFEEWVKTLLHEASHALHAHVSDNYSTARGLFQPTTHGLDIITNMGVAWTEGFAGFLPVAYLVDRGKSGLYASSDSAMEVKLAPNLESADSVYRNVKNESSIPWNSKLETPLLIGELKPASAITRLGDNYAFLNSSVEKGTAEGYVSAVLWDLFDSSAQVNRSSFHSNLRSAFGFVPSMLELPHSPGLSRECQIELVKKRAVSGLPASNKLFGSNIFRLSTDCLSDTHLSRLASVLSKDMYGDLADFAKEYTKSLSDEQKYELWKVFYNNGVPKAAPSAAGHIGLPLEWSPSRSTAKGLTLGDTKVVNNLGAEVKISLTSAMTKAQFLASIPRISNEKAIVKGKPVVENGSYYATFSLQRKGFCGDELRRGYVGADDSTLARQGYGSTYLSLDDGMMPVAVKVPICSIPLVEQKTALDRVVDANLATNKKPGIASGATSHSGVDTSDLQDRIPDVPCDRNGGLWGRFRLKTANGFYLKYQGSTWTLMRDPAQASVISGYLNRRPTLSSPKVSASSRSMGLPGSFISAGGGGAAPDSVRSLFLSVDGMWLQDESLRIGAEQVVKTISLVGRPVAASTRCDVNKTPQLLWRLEFASLNRTQSVPGVSLVQAVIRNVMSGRAFSLESRTLRTNASGTPLLIEFLR